jgi:hypothetical protein
VEPPYLLATLYFVSLKYAELPNLVVNKRLAIAVMQLSSLILKFWKKLSFAVYGVTCFLDACMNVLVSYCGFCRLVTLCTVSLSHVLDCLQSQ